MEMIENGMIIGEQGYFYDEFARDEEEVWNELEDKAYEDKRERELEREYENR